MAARINSVFAPWNRSDSPGCAFGIVQDGRLDVGSLSKQFTAFCVYSLIQDGKLSLDDLVRKHVPELPAYAEPIRIRHLLHHTSGLRDYNDLLLLAGHHEADRTTKDQALDIIVRQASLNFPAGTRHLYSSSSYFLLSVIVERVSGQSMRDFAARRIFTPLGITHSQFNDRYNRVITNRATGYAPADSGFENAMSYWEQTGDSAVLTSVEDLVKWVNNFDTSAVGGRALIDAM